jgi:hypothetical protein
MRRTKVLVVWGAVLTAFAVAGPARADGLPARTGAPEADLEFHGSAVLSGQRMDVRFTPRNQGPAVVTDATVQLRWSVPLADRQHLPAGCVRTGARAVVCGTGDLGADGVGEQVRLAVQLKGHPSEVRLEVDTVWSGGTVDRDRGNDRARVLILDTGDDYAF